MSGELLISKCLLKKYGILSLIPVPIKKARQSAHLLPSAEKPDREENPILVEHRRQLN